MYNEKTGHQENGGDQRRLPHKAVCGGLRGEPHHERQMRLAARREPRKARPQAFPPQATTRLHRGVLRDSKDHGIITITKDRSFVFYTIALFVPSLPNNIAVL